MCEYVSPTLTTIAQPIYELGQQTAEMLLKRINEPTEEWHNKKLPVNIIKGFQRHMLEIAFNMCYILVKLLKRFNKTF